MGSRKLAWIGLFTLVPLGILAATRGLGNASDHRDSPSTIANPQLDVADVFAFMRPEPLADGGSAVSTHLVMVMTVAPAAVAATTFPTNVTYIFTLRRVTDAAAQVTAAPTVTTNCTFLNVDGGKQKVTCLVNGFPLVGDTETVSGNPTDPIRVFAGVRSDPAFGDIQAIVDTASSGQNKLKPGAGTNAFAGANVLGLVVELDVDRFFGADAGLRPILAVAGETVKN